jgi:hypothetical protein
VGPARAPGAIDRRRGGTTIGTLKRMRLYLEQTFDLEARLWSRLTDTRKQPRIPTWVAVKGVWLAMVARLGSLNALEETAGPHWARLVGQALCSADTVSLIYYQQDNEPLRAAIHHVYVTLKRNKALPLNHGQAVAIVDGHESHASFEYHCEDCLTRVVHTEKGDRTQYYHRHVALMLVPGPNPQGESMRLLLDVEPVRAGEDEVSAARRLIRRVVQTYPRAFDLVEADALYANVPFLDFLLSLGKHALIVFKQEQRELYQEALAAIADQEPALGEFRGRDCRWWDVGDLRLPLEHDIPVRVIRSEERWTTQPRNSDVPELHEATWMWLTTMDRHQLPLRHGVHLGHQRWDIENYGFNETVTGWHADHVYRHSTNAMVGFLLTLFLAYNLFFAFLLRNLKPELRERHTYRYWARLVEAALVGPSDPFLAPDDA